MALSVLLILFLPIVSNGILIDDNPCRVTSMEVWAVRVNSSLGYNVTVADETRCRGAPRCYGGTASADGDGMVILFNDKGVDKDIFTIKRHGYICRNRKGSYGLRCGNVTSELVSLPGLDFSARVKPVRIEDSYVHIAVQEEEQAKNFELTFYDQNKKEILKGYANDSGYSIFNLRVENYAEICLIIRPKQDLNDPNCSFKESEMLLCRSRERLLPNEGDNDCKSEVNRKCIPTERPNHTPKPETNKWPYVVTGVAVITLLSIAFMYWKKRKQPPKNILPTYSPDKAPESVVVIHTKESKKHDKEVRDLMSALESSKLKKIYNIYDIKEEAILSNAEPWLLNCLNVKESCSIILVCSSGMVDILRAHKNGKSDADLISTLHRQPSAYDFLLIAAIRCLFDRSFVYEGNRFFVVRFENVEDPISPQKLEESMTEIGLPDIVGYVFSIPTHIKLLKSRMKIDLN